MIKELSECDIKVASITFDGYASNATMSELLGAKLALKLNQEVDPTIKNPFDDSDIQIILIEYEVFFQK